MTRKHVSFFALLFTITLAGLSQTQQKNNPILFSEVLVGHSWGSAGGFSGGAALNFQSHRSLFTLRFLGTTKLDSKVASPLIPIPIIEQRSSLEETSLLYGWRFIDNASAYSFSVGCSYNAFRRQVLDNNNQKVWKTSFYAGVPFEANVKWFKAKKERFRIYGLIPVGKPTAFGGSFGFKLFGNISENSYGGLSIVYGLGFHKKYE